MQFQLNGDQVEVADDGASLLEVLRDGFGLTSVKDGCSPQGQCGCCTVLVDGEPRVSCVTPARRVAGRRVDTLEGLDADVAEAWGATFCDAGASQCGFCTPGIVMRLEGLRSRGGDLADRAVVDRALAAHLCRCTGWQTIVEAAGSFGADRTPAGDGEAAGRRADRGARGPGGVAGGRARPWRLRRRCRAARHAGGLRRVDGEWVTAATMTEARRRGQGAGPSHHGRPAAADRTSGRRVGGHVADAVGRPGVPRDRCIVVCSGREASSPLANGGAFGGKVDSPLPAEAAALAGELGAPVRLRWSREDAVRLGPKRPPMAIGVDADGRGVVRVARTPGIVEAIASVAPDWTVEEVDVAGPPTSASIRAAGWGEVLAVRAALAAAPDGTVEVTAPGGAWASARVADGGVHVTVRCGDVLDATVLRSYAIGAVHMALGWVTSERLIVDDDGEVLSLTIRSLGIVRPGDMVPVDVELVDEPDVEPTSGSDAVFVATAAAVWAAQGRPPMWPTDRVLDSPA
ncbi:MAG: 2Fe-2S iron-sulfur cluster-binding protein [Acidimicrobiales bacterium]